MRYSQKSKIIFCGTAILASLGSTTSTATVFADEVDPASLISKKNNETKDTNTDETKVAASSDTSNSDKKEDTNKEEKTASDTSKTNTDAKTDDKTDEKAKADTASDTKAKATTVDKKISNLAQTAPNYEINKDDKQDTSVKQMLIDASTKANILSTDSGKSQKSTSTVSSKSNSMVDKVKATAQNIQANVSNAKGDTQSEMTYLGQTTSKKFDTKTKKDKSTTVDNYLYNNNLVSVQNYDKDKTGDNQTIHLTTRPVSAVQKNLLSAAQSSKDDKAVQSAVDSIVSSQKKIGSTDVVVRNKDVTPPKIETTQKEINVDKGSDFNANDYVDGATDSQGQSVDYNVEGNVDTSQPGQYTVTVNATDTNGNTASENLKVNVNDDFYQRIANAALSQLGRTQDCTMLVTNSLAAVGINFHGWPTDYLSLGPTTTNPVPGDIIVYQGHVAIYIGNGRAVHGGWMGSQTVEYSVNCGNALIAYVHPNQP